VAKKLQKKKASRKQSKKSESNRGRIAPPALIEEHVRAPQDGQSDELVIIDIPASEMDFDPAIEPFDSARAWLDGVQFRMEQWDRARHSLNLKAATEADRKNELNTLLTWAWNTQNDRQSESIDVILSWIKARPNPPTPPSTLIFQWQLLEAIPRALRLSDDYFSRARAWLDQAEAWLTQPCGSLKPGTFVGVPGGNFLTPVEDDSARYCGLVIDESHGRDMTKWVYLNPRLGETPRLPPDQLKAARAAGLVQPLPPSASPRLDRIADLAFVLQHHLKILREKPDAPWCGRISSKHSDRLVPFGVVRRQDGEWTWVSRLKCPPLTDGCIHRITLFGCIMAIWERLRGLLATTLADAPPTLSLPGMSFVMASTELPCFWGEAEIAKLDDISGEVFRWGTLLKKPVTGNTAGAEETSQEFVPTEEQWECMETLKSLMHSCNLEQLAAAVQRDRLTIRPWIRELQAHKLVGVRMKGRVWVITLSDPGARLLESRPKQTKR
jgi:hypothetical protein